MEDNKILFYDQFLDKKNNLSESSNYPPGSSNDPRAPWNKDDETERTERAKSPSSIDFKLLSTDGEFALFSDRKNEKDLYISYIEDSASIGLEEFRKYTKEFLGRDNEGSPEYEYNYLDDIEEDDIEDWAYSTIKPSDIGNGFDDWESSDFLIVKLDGELAQELYNDFSKYSSKSWRSKQKHFKNLPNKKTLLAYNDMKEDIKKVFTSVVTEW